MQISGDWNQQGMYAKSIRIGIPDCAVFRIELSVEYSVGTAGDNDREGGKENDDMERRAGRKLWQERWTELRGRGSGSVGQTDRQRLPDLRSLSLSRGHAEGKTGFSGSHRAWRMRSRLCSCRVF